MKTIIAEGIHCSGCTDRIEKAFREEGLSCTVSLEEKSVCVAETDAEAALELLDDLGFEGVIRA